MNILDDYIMRPPSHQNAIDLFKGQWSSKLPGDYVSGAIGLFDDERIRMIGDAIGGYDSKRILELGPLEAGHTHMMLEAGAASVVGIEANSRAYTKCLIVKEILGMPGASFLLGDFDSYLELDQTFDFILACGVIYHALNPVRTVCNMAARADRIGIWSQYYEENVVRKIYGRKFNHKGKTLEYSGHSAVCYEHSYGRGLRNKAFIGGGNPTTHWMDRESWIQLWDGLGFDFRILSESTTHKNGPEFTAVALRR